MIRSCQPDPNKLTQRRHRRVQKSRGERRCTMGLRYILALKYTRGGPEGLGTGVVE